MHTPSGGISLFFFFLTCPWQQTGAVQSLTAEGIVKNSVLRSRVREQIFAAQEVFILLTSFSLKFCVNSAYYILICSRAAHEFSKLR